MAVAILLVIYAVILYAGIVHPIRKSIRRGTRHPAYKIKNGKIYPVKRRR